MDWNSIYSTFRDPEAYHIGKVFCDACKGQIRIASRAMKLERRGLCSACEWRNRFGYCQKCGCNINWKTALAKSKCPLGIW